MVGEVGIVVPGGGLSAPDRQIACKAACLPGLDAGPAWEDPWLNIAVPFVLVAYPA